MDLAALARSYDGVATVSELASECETCGVRAPFTGHFREQDGLLYALVRCGGCSVTFPVWDRATAPLLAAWAIAVGDGESGEKLLGSNANAPATRRPFLAAPSVEHAHAAPWIMHILHGNDWIPSPSPRGRWIEAAVAAGFFGAGSSLVEAGYATASSEDIAAAQDAVRRRVVGRAREARRVSWKEGSPYAPDAPYGQIEIVVEQDGAAYAIQNMRGSLRVGTASFEAADMLLAQTVAAKLGAIPVGPLRPGGGPIQITAGADVALFNTQEDLRRLPALADVARRFEAAVAQVAKSCDGPLRDLHPYA